MNETVNDAAPPIHTPAAEGLAGLSFSAVSRNGYGQRIEAIVDNEKAGWIDYSEDGFIEYVETAEPFRRRGVATRLLAQAKASAGVVTLPDEHDGDTNTEAGMAWLRHVQADDNLHDYADDKWLRDNHETLQGHIAGEAVKDFYEELTDPDEGLMTAEAILTMVKEVAAAARVLDRSSRWDSHSNCDGFCLARSMALDIVRDALDAALPFIRVELAAEIEAERDDDDDWEYAMGLLKARAIVLAGEAL